MVKQQIFNEAPDYRLQDVEGLDYSVPQDDELAAEVGIPVTAEDIERHTKSGEKVGALLGKASLPQAVEDPGQTVRQEWVDSMHLTRPSSDGPYKQPTPEDGKFATENMNRVRAANQKVQ